MHKSVYKSDKSHAKIKLLTTLLYYIITYVWSRHVPILIRRHLSLITKLKVPAKIFWFWKLLILQRNQKSFLLSPVYKYLKAIFEYTRHNKGPWLKKTSNTYAVCFWNRPVKQMNQKMLHYSQRKKEKRLWMNGKMMTLTFFELYTVYINEDNSSSILTSYLDI